jgi:DNA primase catalytic subunit
MKMQNLDRFTMIHIPGKEIVIDYMSRHALRDSERTGVEKYVRAVTQADHAVVLERIPTETEQDAELQHLKHAMQTGVWDKKDPILKPCIDIQAELYESENVILRLNKIVPPENLRAKIVRIVHKQGHLGVSKTKEMIRHKYWWPGMNLEIADTVKRCFECQISTETKLHQPTSQNPTIALRSNSSQSLNHNLYNLSSDQDDQNA